MSGFWCRCITVKNVSSKAVTQEETYNGKKKKKGETQSATNSSVRR